MSVEIWIAYVTTVCILMSTPGPSHLLMLSNSLSSGFPRSMATAAGDLSANALQMLAAAMGLAVVIHQSSLAFFLIKWLGVGYLVFLGLRLIFKNDRAIHNAQKPKSSKQLFWQGFVTSAANPKAVVFFTALFPQFIDPTISIVPQFLVLSATYIVVDGLCLLFYGTSANWLSKHVLSNRRRLLDQLSGSFLIAAAIVLGLKTIEPNK
ncbi:MAG: LysE family translocator [Pseudomonadota bacterium]